MGHGGTREPNGRRMRESSGCRGIQVFQTQILEYVYDEVRNSCDVSAADADGLAIGDRRNIDPDRVLPGSDVRTGGQDDAALSAGGRRSSCSWVWVRGRSAWRVLAKVARRRQ